MACRLHHLRFFEPIIEAIHCFALHPSKESLALSRKDASLEIWDLRGCPAMVRFVPGTRSGSVEAICWVGERLLTTGLSGAIVEWNTQSLQVERSVLVTGNAAWCMDVTHRFTKIAIGTEQGYVNIYSVENGAIDYERIFDKQEGRILCCRFDTTGEFLATGSIETIRIWNVETGQALHRMTTGRSERNKETIIWCLEVTPDMTIISGDSRGCITFWDGHLGEHIETVATHKADVLSICLSEDKNSLHCAGVDPIIINFTKVKMKHRGDQMHVEKWVKNIQRNVHQHDVRAMVAVGNKLYSGGIDGYLAMSSFPPKVLVKYLPLQSQKIAFFCDGTDLVCLKYSNHIEIWKLGSASVNEKGEHNPLSKGNQKYNLSIPNGNETSSYGEKETCDNNETSFGQRLQLAKGPELLLRLNGSSKSPIVCCAMSSNKRWIAYSTEIHLKIFKCSWDNDSPTLSKLIPLPDECTPCYQMTFSPNSNNLIIGMANAYIRVFHIHSDGAVTLNSTIDTENVLRDATLIHLSAHIGKADNTFYVVAADARSNIGVWEIGTGKQYSKVNLLAQLPQYNYPPSAITVNHHDNLIVVTYTDQKLIEYNLSKMKFTKWSKNISHTEVLGMRWWGRMFPITGLAIHPNNPKVLMAYDDCGIYVFNKDTEVEEHHEDKKIKTQKEKRQKVNFTTKKYKHLITAGWTHSEDGKIDAALVIAEPSALIEKLPPAFYKKRFGCA